MHKHKLLLLIVTILIPLAGCNLLREQDEGSLNQEIPFSKIESYTTEMVAKGFDLCPDSYLELEVSQIHENPQFNFYSRVLASDILELVLVNPDQGYGFKTQAEIPLSGEGWAGVCKFTSSGTIHLDLQARLFPGESGQPALLVYGNCQCAVTSKPPCGDFGMIPLEEKVLFIIPYKEGGMFERTWKSNTVGVSGFEVWTLHIPCDE